MKTVNTHEAETHLSRLVDEALRGEPFVITRAGKPLVKVTMVDAPEPRRTGFLKGAFDVPNDFDGHCCVERSGGSEGRSAAASNSSGGKDPVALRSFSCIRDRTSSSTPGSMLDAIRSFGFPKLNSSEGESSTPLICVSDPVEVDWRGDEVV